MSAENVELVRVIHDGWARGDFRAGSELYSADFAWDQHAEAVEPGSRRGVEVRAALRNIFEVYDDYRIEAEEFIDGGDQVVVVARSTGVAKTSRMELDQTFAFVWTVREGRLARLQVFTDRDDALRTAGLAA